MALPLFVAADYWHWLQTLKFGRQRMLEAQDADEALCIAHNIQIAYAHLAEDPESPFKDQLQPEDVQTVAIARGAGAS